VLDALHTTCIDSLVLAYPCKMESNLLLPGLKELWQVLEEYVEQQKLLSIGVSDVETDVFIALHDWAKVGVLLTMYELLLEVLHLLTNRICDDSKVPLASNMNSCRVTVLLTNFCRETKIDWLSFGLHCTILAPTFRLPTRVSLQSWFGFSEFRSLIPCIFYETPTIQHA